MNKRRKGNRIWVDVLTPKQALFTEAMVERAPPNVELVITTRDYAELNKFFAQIGLEGRSFGRHGGASVKGKLEASIERMRELVPFVSKEGFSCSLSFISPEAARVSFGLGLEHFVCSDSPHAYAPCRLVIPLASKVFSPFAIKKEMWMRYGVNRSDIFLYHALDPWAWLSSKEKNRARQESENLVLIRLEESFASYVKSGRGVSNVLGKLIHVVKSLGNFEIIIVPRYDEQRDWAKKEFGKTCTVPDTTINGADLISKASLVIGGGGTMTQEAALLGIPNISYFPSSELDVFEGYLFPKKLSIKASTPRGLIRETSQLLSKAEEIRREFGERAHKAVSNFEDPVSFIFKRILEE